MAQTETQFGESSNQLAKKIRGFLGIIKGKCVGKGIYESYLGILVKRGMWVYLGDWGLVSGSLHSHVVEHFFHEEPVQELFIIDIEVLSVLQEVK